MGRRWELGPIVALLGALLLLASLFVSWFEPGRSAWQAFEIVDVLLAGLALATAAAALGVLAPSVALLDARWLAPMALATLGIVAVQLIEPPPAVAGAGIDTGGWLALGAGLLMAAGSILTLGRIRFAISYEGRDLRRRVAAVDARSREGAQRASTAGGRAGAAPAGAPTAVARAPAAPGERSRRPGASGSSPEED